MGRVHTYWNLYLDDSPVAQYPSLAQAKIAAQRLIPDRRSYRVGVTVEVEVTATAAEVLNVAMETVASRVPNGRVSGATLYGEGEG
jgi:hypothetical protein